jgi:hypothetical protein
MRLDHSPGISSHWTCARRQRSSVRSMSYPDSLPSGLIMFQGGKAPSTPIFTFVQSFACPTGPPSATAAATTAENSVIFLISQSWLAAGASATGLSRRARSCSPFGALEFGLESFIGLPQRMGDPVPGLSGMNDKER